MKSRKKHPFRRWLPVAATALLATGIGTAAVFGLRDYFSKPALQMKRVVQEVQLIRPPPPPPEPPPPEEIPEEVDIPEPEQMPDPGPMDDAPPADLLGLDAEGTAGGDGFGLLARRGGRDFLAGAGGSVYTWYAGRVKNEILDQLAADERVRSRRYTVMVRIWVHADGRIDRVVLADSTGSAEVDGVLQAALNDIQRMSDSPPPDMPQPIQVRIVSRS